MNRPLWLAAVLCFSLSACASFHDSMDKMSARVDLMEAHMGASEKPLYEGRLSSAQKIGPMVSLQFADGKLFDVSDAPDGIAVGDTLRIFKTDKGYVAHLWKQAPKEEASANALAPLIR